MQPDLEQIVSGLAYALQSNVTVETTHGSVMLDHFYAGDLTVTSGRIVACDPGWADEEGAAPFSQRIAPGRYPVILSIEHMKRRSQVDYKDYQSVAFATLRWHERMPVRWEVATFDDSAGDENDEGIPGYGVDTGMGCFMDADAARVFIQRLQADPEYHNVLARGMDESDPTGTSWGWGNVGLEPDTPANLIFFSAGAGDGAYASYFGYDADNSLVCLVTDFALLWPES